MNFRTRRIEEITPAFARLFGTLSEEDLNWKPDAQTWSIAQNIEHLILVNESYYPVLESLRSGSHRAPFLGRIGFLVSLLGKAILGSVQPDRKRKMKTFPLWRPKESRAVPGILAQFEAHQAELVRRIEAAVQVAGGDTVISSPANRNIVYTLETAFDIMAAHEKRHLEQAREVLQRLQDSRRGPQ